MRIGIFSDTISLPPKEGISVHVYNLLRYLALYTTCEVFLFMCDRGTVATDLFKKEPFTTVLLPEVDFFSIDNIKKLLKQFSISVAQSHKTYISATVLGEACSQLEIPMVAEFHDLEEDVLPLYFTGKELKKELKKHIEFQYQASRYASFVRVMSSYDYTRIKETWPNFNPKKFKYLPVASGGANDLFTLNPNRKRIGYIGNMSYKPNKDGADAIINKVLPKIAGSDIYFVGRESEKYQDTDIDALGLVDDLTPLLSDTVIGLAPIFSGSGMKIKNLTYLKHGIPVLTTTIGARGYPNSRAIIIEDNLEKWPAIIKSLMSNQEKQTELSNEALTVFTKYFLDKTINSSILDIYKTCLKKTGLANNNSQNIQQSDINPREMYWFKEFREHIQPTLSQMSIIRPYAGRLIVLEGLPGAGKSTLLSKLQQNLGFVSIPETLKLDNTESDLAFVNQDIQKYAFSFTNALSCMDRGYHSTLAVEYALSPTIKYRPTQKAIQQHLQQGSLYRADLTIILDIDSATSLARQNPANSSFWRQPEVLRSVKQYYKSHLVSKTNSIVIDATLSEQSVYNIVLQQLANRGLI